MRAHSREVSRRTSPPRTESVTVFASPDGKDRTMIPIFTSTEPEWRTLASQASEERDPDKLFELGHQIVEKYEAERGSTKYTQYRKRKLEKVLQRIARRAEYAEKKAS